MANLQTCLFHVTKAHDGEGWYTLNASSERTRAPGAVCHQFRTFDDDGNRCTRGFVWLTPDASEHDVFAPLFDHAAGHSGAVRLDILDPDGGWDTVCD